MSSSRFRELFKKSAAVKREGIEKLHEGEPWPAYRQDNWVRDSEEHIIFFISLSCSSCIDLLPLLNSFSKEYKGKFILVGNGSPDEHQEIMDYFKFAFPFYSLSDMEIRQLFGVPSTPYAYLIDKGIVERSSIINTIDGLMNWGLEPNDANLH